MAKTPFRSPEVAQLTTGQASGDSSIPDDRGGHEANEAEQRSELKLVFDVVRSAVLSRRLARVNSKLDSAGTLEKEMSGNIVSSKTEAKHAKIGRLAVVNMNLISTYIGERREFEKEKVRPDAFEDLKVRKKYMRNERKIERILSKIPDTKSYMARLNNKKVALEMQLGIRSDEEPTDPTVYTPVIRALDVKSARELREKTFTITTHEIYRSLLEEAATKKVIDRKIIQEAVDRHVDYSDQSGLFNFTNNKLVRNGVIDAEGKVLKNPEEISNLLSFSDRQSPSEPEPEDGEKLEYAQRLFYTTEEYVKRLVEENGTARSSQDKYNAARKLAWNEAAYMVDPEGRAKLHTLFMHLLKETTARGETQVNVITDELLEPVPEPKTDTPKQPVSNTATSQKSARVERKVSRRNDTKETAAPGYSSMDPMEFALRYVAGETRKDENPADGKLMTGVPLPKMSTHSLNGAFLRHNQDLETAPRVHQQLRAMGVISEDNVVNTAILSEVMEGYKNS